MSKAIFLTGTGTDIGKTFIAGLIVKKLAQAGKNPAYYKAAMSGNDPLLPKLPYFTSFPVILS